MASQAATDDVVDIKPLLMRLWPQPEQSAPPTAEEIADAVALFFTNQVSDVQASALLMCLHFTSLDRQADVMAACASRMRQAAARVDAGPLRQLTARHGAAIREKWTALASESASASASASESASVALGSYRGGLCDIVGTGGDSHNTFNVSTASSIIASAYLMIGKHGNRASTSRSGSADLLAHLPGDREHPEVVANLQYIRPDTLAALYAETNYAFLFAPVFHPGMRYVAPIRRQLPWRTLFNLLGPLANPADVSDSSGSPPSPSSSSASPLEARVIGVARRELGPVFAEALRMAGARKALVVCGAEELDEVSIAGPTFCWQLKEETPAATATASTAATAPPVSISHFQLTPADFGVATHPLTEVSPGRSPAENAATMLTLLYNERTHDDPLLSFVLINTAALLVVSGLCDGEGPAVITERGPGGGRWKEGVRLARRALSSGEARQQWRKFVAATNP